MIVEEVLQLKRLRQELPELFEGGHGKTLLYVGASRLRGFHVLTLWALGYKLTLLEVHPPNAAFWQQADIFERVIVGDVRYLPPLPVFNVAVWWHGPEHIEAHELPGTLNQLEDAANLVILACPHGEYAQGAVGGNEAETHRWSVGIFDLTQFDYTVVPYQAATPELLAWKRRAT